MKSLPPATAPHVFRHRGRRTLFSTSVDHQEGAFFAELNVTAERDVEVVISHGAARRSPKAELNASLEDWPELRALLLEIIAEADRLIPEVEAL